MSLQRSRDTTPFSKKGNRVTVICDGVSSPANIGGLFRLCDAFGVEKIVFCDTHIDLNSPRLRKTARNTETRTAHTLQDDILKSIAELKAENYRIIGLEITSKSESIQQLTRLEIENIALVIGGEQHGISQSVLNELDHTIHIEMFGTNSSMNVTHAAAIALFELTKS